MLIINSQQYLHPDLDELLGFLLCFVFLSVIQKMEESVTTHGRNSNKGLWNCPRFKYSKDTQELMQGVFVWPGLSFDFFLLIDYLIDWLISTVMMQESRLTNFQQRQINKQLKSKLYMFYKSPHQFHLWLLFTFIDYRACVRYTHRFVYESEAFISWSNNV